jgi:putative membrane protein
MPSEAAAAERLDRDARRLHPLTLGFAAVGIARQMIWPALVGGFGLGDGELARMVPIVVGVLAVPALVGAAAKYALYRWRLDGDELLLRSGVLNRQNRVIPLARVQNVEVRQSLVQRLAGVAELRVETAGSGLQAEAHLSVLGIGEAQALRGELLARRRAHASLSAPAADAEGAKATADADARPAAPPLAQLSTWDVLLAGATANEAGVIAAALAGLLQFADDLPGGIIETMAERAIERMEGAVVLLGAIGVVLFLLLGWLISIAGAVVRYHGFTLAVDGGEMRKRYGLLTVHEASVPLQRVQAIRVEETFLRRWLGLASLMIETAGGSPGQAGGAEAFVPIARRREVGRLVRGIFGEADVDAAEFTRVHPKAERRMVRRYLAWFLVLWAPFWAARWLDVQPGGMMAPWMAVFLPLVWMMARWQYQNRGWALPPGYVMARSGVMNRITWIVPDRKLQTLHLRETLFQRRLGLSTLVVDTAAGGRQASVIDLAHSTARRLLEELATRARRSRQEGTAQPRSGGETNVAADNPLATGLIGGVEEREIRIVDYQPEWPERFQAHARIIAGALGGSAMRIEHIGSTSVPGLAAKPIIDILVAVPDSADESAYLPQLQAAGYDLRVREPDWNEHRMFRSPERDVHVHVYSAGCPEIDRTLAFRDRLRQNPDDRRRYEQTKRELAARHSDMNLYADAKTEVIESILAASRAGGKPSGDAPPPG